MMEKRGLLLEEALVCSLQHRYAETGFMSYFQRLFVNTLRPEDRIYNA